MFDIVLCEDNSSQLKSLTTLTNNILKDNKIEYNLTSFLNSESLIDSHKNFDIYLLDIQLDKISGIDLAKKIRSSNSNAIIIFITALKDYVFDAFDVQAFNYILKPIDNNKFEKVLLNAISLLNKKNKFILAKYNGSSTKIFLNDIKYIESFQRKIKIHTNYDILEYYYKLSLIEKELSNDNFFRCHKSFIVNLKYIRSYTSSSIILKSNEEIFLSKYKYLDFSKTFMYYLKNEGF